MQKPMITFLFLILLNNNAFVLSEPFNVVQVAKFSGLKTFAQIVDNSIDLHEILTHKGSYTVFAPSNDAFARLPLSVINNKTLITRIVEYHIVPIRIDRRNFTNDALVQSLVHGVTLRLNEYQYEDFPFSGYCVGGTRAQILDYPATNGLVYVLDDVIYPLPTKDAFEAAALQTDYSTMSFLLVKDKLDSMLKESPHLTIFSPTNEAFQKLSVDDMSKLLTNDSFLDATLKSHVVNGTYYTAAVPTRVLKRLQLISLSSTPIELGISSDSNSVTVNSANIVQANITVTNGVIHVIDHVLISP